MTEPSKRRWGGSWSVGGATLAAMWVCVLGALPACDPSILDEGGGGPTPGKVCYVDSDCVPNDCCGRGTGVVHAEDGPQCGDVVCDDACDPGTIDCGCALPVCSDGACVVARTYNEQCE